MGWRAWRGVCCRVLTLNLSKSLVGTGSLYRFGYERLGVDTGCCLPGKMGRYAADLLNWVSINDAGRYNAAERGTTR